MSTTTINDVKDRSAEARRRIGEQTWSQVKGEGQPGGKAGEIIAVLTSRLATGALSFGQTLSIKALAEEFDASRQPVAAAISHLRSLGYVVVVPQVGCRVVSPSAKEIQDFFLVLARVEASYAGLAAQRYLDQEAKVLSAIAAEVAKIEFGEAGLRRQYASGVDAFHAMIWEMSRTSAVVSRTRNLWQLADFYLWQGAENFDVSKVDIANSERKEIAHAIEFRDVRKAELLLEEHVRGKPLRVGIV